MGAVAITARAELRRHRGAILALALAVALGLGAALGAFIAAQRTDRAYPDHLARAHVADLVVNPSLNSADAERVLRGLPHLRRVATSDLMFAGVWDGRDRTLGEVLADANPGQVHGSLDTRYAGSDRLIVDEGHRPTGRREVFVTESYRPVLSRRLGHPVGLGDRVPVAFLWAGADVNPTPETVDAPFRPIAVEQLRVAGFGRLADEVLDDPVYPRQEVIVSPDVARKYSCTSRISSSDDPETILRALVPETCSSSYRYFALDVDDPANVPAVARAAQRRLSALNADLPAGMRSIPNGPEYYPVITTRQEEQAAVQHLVRPSVVALEIFGGVAAAATLAVMLLVSVRIMRSARATDEIVRALGLRRGQRVLTLALPSMGGVILGSLGAVVVGVALSPIGPVGDVARVAGHWSFSAPLGITVATVAIGMAALLACIGVTAYLAAGPHRDRAPRAGGRALRRLLAPLRPEVADGVATAFARGRVAVLPAASAVAIAAVVAATLFSVNVGALVGDSHRYGWPWQVGVLNGFGYGETDRAAVAETLRARPEVRSWDELGFGSATVQRTPVALLYGARPIDLAVVQGRLPRRAGEAVLGRSTADRLGIRVGERVRLGLGGDDKSVRVVGTAVMPAIGQYQSDRAGLGLGAFVLVPKREMTDDAVTFVGIHLEPGTDATRALRSIRAQVVRWDKTGSPPYTYPAAVRPAEIVNADALRGAPLVLAGVLALALLTALALSLAATVSARRHDYAVLRTIGFTSGQVARSVRWHALAAVGAGLLVGIPVGIVGGRLLWAGFAEQLGVGPAPTFAVTQLLVVGVAALLAALASAVLPARRAVRLQPAEVLHGA